MKMFRLFVAAFMLTFAVSAGFVACGGEGGDSCPGIVCNNCATDCNITCAAGEQEFCGHFGYFEDPNLRCTWCE
jgi:hypothetical protein